MIEKLRSQNITLIFCFLFFVKMIFLGSSVANCLGLFIIIVGVQADFIVEHLFPKRVDLFQEVDAIKSKLSELQSLSDNHERDLTAIKLTRTR